MKTKKDNPCNRFFKTWEFSWYCSLSIMLYFCSAVSSVRSNVRSYMVNPVYAHMHPTKREWRKFVFQHCWSVKGWPIVLFKASRNWLSKWLKPIVEEWAEFSKNQAQWVLGTCFGLYLIFQGCKLDEGNKVFEVSTILLVTASLDTCSIVFSRVKTCRLSIKNDFLSTREPVHLTTIDPDMEKLIVFQNTQPDSMFFYHFCKQHLWFHRLVPSTLWDVDFSFSSEKGKYWSNQYWPNIFHFCATGEVWVVLRSTNKRLNFSESNW